MRSSPRCFAFRSGPITLPQPKLASSLTRSPACTSRAPAAGLVIVNAAEVELAHNEADYEKLFHQLQSIHKGRHSANPMPFD